MPKSFDGSKIDAADVDSWIFSMDLYFEALAVPPEQRAVRAALNLTDEAALWLRT